MARGLGALRIIRQRLVYIHKSLDSKEITNEYTLRNETDKDIRNIFLLRLPLMLNLEVYDESGKQLPYLPNSLVRQILQPFIDEDQSGEYQELREMLEPTASKPNKEHYFLWIRLPETDKIRGGEMKIIRLKYLESPQRIIPALYKTRFSVERHRIQINKVRTENYDMFVNIAAPQGYRLAYTVESDLTVSRGLYQSRLDDYGMIRIPPRNENIDCTIYYEILPSRTEERFFKATIIPLYVVAEFLLFLALLHTHAFLNFDPTGVIIQNVLLTFFIGVINRMFEIVAGLIGLAVAIIGLVRDPLFFRARVSYLGIIVIAVYAYIIYSHA